jgi:hypothetical protein
MSYFRCSGLFATAAIACLLPVAAVAQQPKQQQMTLHDDVLKQAAAAPTPRTPDGHPDFTGLWNGILVSPENVSQLARDTSNELWNAGIDIGADGARDIFSGAVIEMFPPAAHVGNVRDTERANSLGRRMGSNKPIYKPEYWARVQDFDANSNENDPAFHCMAAGVPRIGVPAQIGQSSTRLILVYPGQGGLLATQSTYRIIPTDGRKHTALDDLDGTWNGEGIGHWDGDTMVIDTIGFNSSTYLDQVGGYFHSENMHVIERFQREGNTLTWQATVDDPDVLLKPWTTNKRVVLLNPDPNAVLAESMPCSERDFAHTVTKEHH